LKVLVLGGSGLLGRALIAHLGAGGHAIHAIVRSEESARKVEAAHPDAITLSREDATGQSFDRLINLVVDYGRGGGDLSALLRTNLLYPLEIAEAARADAILNVSSALPADYSDYAFSKKMLEEALDRFAGRRGVRNVNIHLHNMYGPIFDETNLVSSLIARMRRGEKVELSSCANSRDFIFIDDVVAAIETVATRVDALPDGAPVAVGSGIATPLRSLVETLQAKTGSRSPVLYGARPDNPREPAHLAADLTALSAAGWTPGWSLDAGLEETLGDTVGEA
jgi:nucleoside-diphosphate-sugar epimerase